MEIKLNDNDVDLLLRAINLLSEQGRLVTESEQARLEIIAGRIILKREALKAVQKSAAPKANLAVVNLGSVAPNVPKVPDGIVQIDVPRYKWDIYLRTQDTTEYLGRAFNLEKAKQTWLDSAKISGRGHLTLRDCKVYFWDDGQWSLCNTE